MLIYFPSNIDQADLGSSVDEMSLTRHLPDGSNDSKIHARVRVRGELWDHSRICSQATKFESDHLELFEILGSHEYNDSMYSIVAQHVATRLEHKRRCSTLHHPHQDRRRKNSVETAV